MPESTRISETRAAGYEELTRRLELEVIPNWHQSFVAGGNTHRVEVMPGGTIETYPARYWPGDGLGDHLEFALKYDGTNLAILASVFLAVPEDEVSRYVQSKPRGKYARRIWYLYEFLTGSRLPLADLSTGGYVDLLDPTEYFTVASSRRVRRQKINDNLLGDSRFCPTVRRSETLMRYLGEDLAGRCSRVISGYSPELLRRALSYLYTKETRSSFEIEHVKPSPTRTERFIALLQLAEKQDFCRKPKLIELQNLTVDARFRATDYRDFQNYVGESLGPERQRVHFVCPKPKDVETLMAGLIAAHQRMDSGGVPAVVHAAAIAYGFVFVHPFEDGNGRIHRFLIHNLLARSGFTPDGLMFPVSAAMLKDRGAYDASLEAFSRPLMLLVDYSLDDTGQMIVENDTRRWYSYIDLTPQAEALFRFVERTIDRELADELSFLSRYDEAKAAIQDIVDMPDRKIDLFVRFCLQNDGRLSERKRERHFEFLSEVEIARMEAAVAAAYAEPGQT